MPLSQLPAPVSAWFAQTAAGLDCRSTPRFFLLLLGALLARGRRTVTSWFRAAGITDDFRPAYHALAAAGRRSEWLTVCGILAALQPLWTPYRRLVFALDDTPTPRYGPRVEGAGIHHNPSPGPAGEQHVYGHNWVTLAWLGPHPLWGCLAIPLLAKLYVRAKDVARLPADRPWEFRTKLELAAGLLRWLCLWIRWLQKELWVVADGAYAKKPFLRAAAALGVTVVSRLRKDAALWTLPSLQRRPGQRGPLPTYGSRRIRLAARAASSNGWQTISCTQYRQLRRKRIKTFVATWRPVGGPIRVVLVQEATGWLAFFCTNLEATAAEILAVAADRGAIEQTFKDLKEVWGAGQQQVRHIYTSIGAFHVNVWLHGLVEAWAWNLPEEVLLDRSAAPWDQNWRRPSHADRRRALQREILCQEIQAVTAAPAEPAQLQRLADLLIQLAA